MPQPSSCSGKQYGANVEDFYSALRQTWERLVEERLLNGVVGRFQPGVKTQSLKSVAVDDADYQKVFFAMAKASNYSGHDHAVARRSSLPGLDEMKKDLDDLRAYDTALGRRADNLGKRR